jgi:hypothetical protein
MAVKSLLREILSKTVRPHGYEIVDRAVLYDWQQPSQPTRPTERPQLPASAVSYLTDENALLKDLRERYAAFNGAVTTPFVWRDDLISGDHLRWFREDHAYVWQLRGPNMNRLGYALSAYYARTIDTLALLDRLSDDNLFGNITFEVGGRTVSRDLLDSIIEIYFLERHLGISSRPDLRLLDIGAGYGRLAHRIVEAFPNVDQYLCTDAVAASTFISDYYLKFRQCERATVVPLDEIDKTLGRGQIDVAINVHSFSECRLQAIDWWLSILQTHRVRYLMIVPNATRQNDGRLLATNDGQDFEPLIRQHGYRLLVREPKYRDPVVQDLGINPTYHFLFELA